MTRIQSLVSACLVVFDVKAKKDEALRVLHLILIQKNLFIVFFLALIFAPLSTACRTAATNSAQAIESSAEQREVVDDLGRHLRVPAKIDRAVSLAPSVTENVFAIGAGDKLIGVTTYCNFPAEETSKISKIGDTLNPNLETIVALRPQVVVVSTDSQLQAFIEKMEAQKIPVFVVDAKNFADVLHNLKQLGELFNVSDKTEKLIQNLETRVAVVADKTAKKKNVDVFVQISREPLFTIGKESFITDSVNRAGGVSATADLPTAYPKISEESALAMQPEAIILSVDDAMGSENGEPAEVLKNTPAVKNNRVYKINGEWLARPGPRVVDGIEAMAEFLHPTARE